MKFFTLAAAAALAGQSLAILTTGQAGNGVQLRREIRDLINDKTTWNIYLLALQSIQANDQSSLTSWYQLAGIHGRPQAPYDGVGGVANPQAPGYCTHVSNLFPTWHRPYLALYEQALVQAAIDIANQFTGSAQTKYLAAAQKLRAPYWDWAKVPAGSAYPSAFTSKTATVTTPTGTKTITNPLYLYNFHPNPGDLYYQPFVYWNTTLRWPTSDSDPNASSQDSQAAANVGSWRSTLHDRVYNVLTTYSNYNQFSNEAWITNSGTQDSLESIHDVIHGAVGGTNYGHMSIVDVSAFDPIFWLHHVMVDRLFALWQALYPNSYFQQQTQNQGTYWYASGYVSKSNTPLKPFKQTAGTFWTSDSVRDWTKFYYTYPELQTGYTTASVTAAVNSLYGPSGSSSKKRSVEEEPMSFVAKLRSRSPWKRDTAATAPLAATTRYSANIKAQKNLGSSYFIYFFLGEVTSSVENLGTDPNVVGVNPIISNTMPEDKAAQAKPVLIGGSVPLDTAIQDKYESGDLKSLDEADVLPYLQENLSWKVKNSNGTEVDPASVPNLLISVASQDFAAAKSSTSFPKPIGKTKLHTSITTDKPAGICITEAKQYTNVNITTSL